VSVVHAGFLGCAVLEPVAAAGDLDDVGVVEEAVEYGGCGGHVATQVFAKSPDLP